MARASASDSSQLVADATGDQRARVTPVGVGTVPLGSSSQQAPGPLRLERVAARTSGFVEVTTAGPGAAMTLGIATALDLPERGGPSTSTACSGSARAIPPGVVPR